MATAAASPAQAIPLQAVPSWHAQARAHVQVQEESDRGPGCFDVVISPQKNAKHGQGSIAQNTSNSSGPIARNHGRPRIRTDSDDPLSIVLRPPPNEAPEERQARLKADAEAEARSKEIDGEIAEARKGWERRKKGIKVLLLGQAESGKSTTLKNFQLTFSPKQFREERLAWRTVVQFNLIQNVKTILDTLADEWSEAAANAPPISLSHSSSFTGPSSSSYGIGIAGPSSSSTGPSQSSSSSSRAGLQPNPNINHSHNHSSNSNTGTPLTNAHKVLAISLSPLLQVEALLTRKLNPEAGSSGFAWSPTTGFGPGAGSPGTSSAITSPSGGGDSGFNFLLRERRSHDLFVRAGSAWKSTVAASSFSSKDKEKEKDSKDKDPYSSASWSAKGKGKKRDSGSTTTGTGNGTGTDTDSVHTLNGPASYSNNQGNSRIPVPDDPTTVIAACRENIVELWKDGVVQEVLRRRKVKVEDMPGFFLNDTERIATASYEPTDDDILRARLRTLGVEEHKFKMEASTGSSRRDWYIYDVGGCRGVRHTWVPYFDDVEAIIFLAPLAFNQTLEEDPSVNRLEDSFALWKKICSNKLLQNATMILFLNKMDVLKATLESGVKLNRYVTSYGDGPNDVRSVTRYFRNKFKAYQKQLSPQPRLFFCHETSVIDSRATSAILIGVREGILRGHLQHASVL